MKKAVLFLTLLVSANGFSQCSELFFSEYIEGSSNNKSIEVYNPTSATIDLNDYVIYRYNNGSALASDSLFMNANLVAGDVFVIANPSADPLILAVSDTTHTITFYNGDDAMMLKNRITGDTLDIIGIIGIDPGTNWPVGTGATSEFTLIRQIGINQGQTDWAIGATEWDVYPQNTFDSLGFHNMTPCGSCANTFASVSAIACESLVSPSGMYTWTTSGNYMDTIPNAAGCDSVLTIDVTINAVTTSSITESACNSYVSPSGNTTWTATGIYTDIVPNANGCDSVITVDLTITSVNVGVTQTANVLTADLVGASYQWIDCSDNSPISGETSQTYTASADGDFAVIVTDGNCSDTSACSTVLFWGIDEAAFAHTLVIAPNPTTGETTIQFGAEVNNVRATVYSVSGQEITSTSMNNGTSMSLNIDGEAGFYLVVIESETGERAQLNVIKQ
jgi:hypothetical protein